MARRLTNSFDCFMVIETVGLFSRPFLPKNGSFPLQQRMADQILTQLKQHPDAWTRVDTILEYSNNQQTKVRWTENLLFFKRFFNDIYICLCVCFFTIVLCVTNTWGSHQDAMENSPSRAVRRSETCSYYCTSCQDEFAISRSYLGKVADFKCPFYFSSGIKKYIVGLIIKISSEADMLEVNALFVISGWKLMFDWILCLLTIVWSNVF